MVCRDQQTQASKRKLVSAVGQFVGVEDIGAGSSVRKSQADVDINSAILSFAGVSVGVDFAGDFGEADCLI